MMAPTITRAVAHLDRHRLPLFILLLSLRVVDFTQTALGLRLQVPEANPWVHEYGLAGLLILHLTLLLILAVLLWLGPPPIRMAGHVVLLLYLAQSLYTVAWNNPLALGAG
jgi:hypothetical protein